MQFNTCIPDFFIFQQGSCSLSWPATMSQCCAIQFGISTLAIPRADLNHSSCYLSAQIIYCLNAGQRALSSQWRNLRKLFDYQVICQWSTFTSSLHLQPLISISINTIPRVLFYDVLWAETHYDNCFNVKPGASLFESSAAFNQQEPKHRNASNVEVSRWALFFNWLCFLSQLLLHRLFCTRS